MSGFSSTLPVGENPLWTASDRGGAAIYTEDDLLPISALQHLRFCRRRCALVHLEQLWAENRFTAEGRHLHRRVDDPRLGETRPGIRISRSLEIRSYQLGLCGKADVVEFRDAGPGVAPEVTIVEYKRGRPKKGLNDEFHVQVCAQALCLEEMLGVTIDRGAIFYGKVRRRDAIIFDQTLRQRTHQAIEELHNMIRSGYTPQAKYERKCRRCSLRDLCMPKAMRPRATAARYLAELVVEEEE